jgi:predicted MPP superfamily phosphohydrolase
VRLRRLLLILLLLLVGGSLLASAHLYLATRLILEPGFGEPWRAVLLGVLVCLGAGIVLEPFAERLLEPRLVRVIAWPTYLWMGFMFLLLVLLGVSDLALWLLDNVALAAADGPGGGASAARVRAATAVAAALVAGALGVRSALLPPRHTRVEIALERWPRALDGFRIVQISDTHIGPLLGRRFAEHVVSRANALAPDLVAVTGDLVDGSVRRLAGEVAPFARLEGRHGVFFVTGNHDHYLGADSWAAVARELGMRVLRNQRVEIRVGDAVFDLVGVDDHRSELVGDGGEDLPAALSGRDPGRPAILLAHDPSTFKQSSAMGVDLQISGHTHGGQIWPFGGVVRLVIPYVAGHFRKNGAQLYVSRGTGFWGPPMRLFAPAELTEIVVRCAHSH